MRTHFVNLYQYFGLEKPEFGVGEVSCLALGTPRAVSPCRRRPAVLVVPGGGYGHVSDREAECVALRFVAKGWAAFVLRYAVAPARYPVALREAAYAMRYIRENADAFEVDPHMVAATGFSAGGHLCGCLGTLWDAPELSDVGMPEQLRPDALGLCYPVCVSHGRTHDGSFLCLCAEDMALRERLSLEKLARPDMPPVFLWHTRDDATVPCRGTLLLASALEEAGVDFSLHLYRQGVHGLSTADAMAYCADRVPQVSRDVPGWVELEIAFFEDTGLKIQDFVEDIR